MSRIYEYFQNLAWIIIRLNSEVLWDKLGYLLTELAYKMEARRNSIWSNPDNNRTTILTVPGRSEMVGDPLGYRRCGSGFIAAVRDHE